MRGAETVVKLMGSALASSTSEQYGRLFGDFAEYCEQEGVSPLPASRATILCYVGYIAELGTWAEESMQPIFSAINDAHRSLELEPPAVGDHFLTRARQGMRRAQAAIATRDTRIPTPASSIISILDDCEQSMDLEQLREGSAICLASLFAGRQDSAVHLRSEDIRIEADFIWLRLTEKGKKGQRLRRVLRIPLSIAAVHGHASALPRVAALLRRYFRERSRFHEPGSPPAFAFQLPFETRPTTSKMEKWVERRLHSVGVVAPPGFAYQGHSLRSMGASCMAAIGIERHIYVWVGGWARGSDTVDKHYIDPTVLPTPAAYALWGWALTRQYTADAGMIEWHEPLPDPALEAPLEPTRVQPKRRAAPTASMMRRG